jgi:hypothetical protein
MVCTTGGEYLSVRGGLLYKVPVVWPGLRAIEDGKREVQARASMRQSACGRVGI